mmetsp:Transcript_38054/g.98768  ORF Transcript_38054/g.98768 Transcript_38054/m.98768 type:complete len:230 (+) Transcript_38054:1144-1833(+)
MSILPIFGCMRSRCFCFSFFWSSFSWYACRISLMPVASIKSGSWKMGFSMPRLPCRNLRFCDQCSGTGTVLRQLFRNTRRRGSCAVTSHTSTTSGMRQLCLSSAIFRRLSILRFFLESLSGSPSSLSLSASPSSSLAASASFSVSAASAAAASSSPPSPGFTSSSAFMNFWKISWNSEKMGLSSSPSSSPPRSIGADTYSSSTSSSSFLGFFSPAAAAAAFCSSSRCLC